MSLHFFLESAHRIPADDSRTRIYVDGTSRTMREGRDIELSHWNPNTTGDHLAADSSTEIALNFLLLEELPAEGLIINNHLDIDGILAAWCLTQPALAQANREVLIEVAEIGDFWSWGSTRALSIYQRLHDICSNYEHEGDSAAEAYEACFAALPALLSGEDDTRALESLMKADTMVEAGSIPRRLYHSRFVAYQIPQSVHGGDLEKALTIDPFNSSLDRNTLLPAHVRNHRDACRVQLVSVEGEKGWYHDLHYPGYMWAETVDRWRAPGFWEGDNSNTWYFRFAPLEEALDKLRDLEKNPGVWQSAEELPPFKSVLGRAFPVVASFLSEDDEAAESSLKPDVVAEILLRAFTYDHTSAH
jgi:hypothetical protein